MKTSLRIFHTLINLVTSARFVVDGDSMAPALKSRQSVLAVRPRFVWNRLRRGDIVVLRHPVQGQRTYIKRIVALPNEEVRLEDGSVYLDGVLMEDSGSGGPIAGEIRSEHLGHRGEWWTGPEEYFVLGDNRGDSQDSRAFGPVNRHLILGRVWFRCWPPGALGPVPRHSGDTL